MSKLPKGVRLVPGSYIQVRIMRKGQVYTKNFGQDDPLARELAMIHAAEKYKEFREGTIGIAPKARMIKFSEARKIFYQKHYEDYRDPETHEPRTEGSKVTARGLLSALGTYFDPTYLHDISIPDVEAYKTKRLDTNKVGNATFNRERGILSSLFSNFQEWGATGRMKAVKLPVDKEGKTLNPCEYVKALTEKGRERIPDTWELAAAYKWCQEHDGGLWEAIESALLTALRKQDLIALDGSLTVKGIQQKTGEKFDLPVVLAQPVNLVNWKRRWNALRLALTWLPYPKGAPTNPKHTTWHDLRHWAPTLLGEQGFSTKIIQSYLGHSKEETTERYTNIRRKALEPAVKTVQEAIEQLKGK